MGRRSMKNNTDIAQITEYLRNFNWTLSRRLKIETTGSTHLTQAQETVLARLRQKPNQTSAEIARIECVSPQAMGAIVATLLTENLIFSSRNPNDGRRRELNLTESGIITIDKVRDLRNDWLYNQLTKKLTPEEQEKVLVSLKILEKIIDN